MDIRYYNTGNYDNHNGKILLSYFIWPFGTWIYCLFHPQSKSSYIVFFLFSVLLCWHFSPNSESGYDDFIGIMERFETFSDSTDEVREQIVNYFTFSENAPKEIYEIVLMWLVKLFTDNYHFYFLLASIPVALCQLKSLKLITNDERFESTFYGILIIILFIIPRDIIAVQNPRFSTGLWICVIASIFYFYDDKHKFKYPLLVLAAPLCHSGIWPYTLFFFISILLRCNPNVLRTCAIISIPFCFFDADLFQNFNFDILPVSISTWAERYMSDESYAHFILREGKSGYWWVAEIFRYLTKIAYIWMTLQIINFKDIKDRRTEHIVNFYLMLFIFTNMIQFVPEMNTRYYNIFRIISVFVWFKLFGLDNNRSSSIFLVSIAALWGMLFRYGYILGGALSVTTPTDIFYTPLPYLCGKGLFW